jgi:hypothetical protein
MTSKPPAPTDLLESHQQLLILANEMLGLLEGYGAFETCFDVKYAELVISTATKISSSSEVS